MAFVLSSPSLRLPSATTHTRRGKKKRCAWSVESSTVHCQNHERWVWFSVGYRLESFDISIYRNFDILIYRNIDFRYIGISNFDIPIVSIYIDISEFRYIDISQYRNYIFRIERIFPSVTWHPPYIYFADTAQDIFYVSTIEIVSYRFHFRIPESHYRSTSFTRGTHIR